MSSTKQVVLKEYNVNVDMRSSAADAESVADPIKKEGPAIHPAFAEPLQFDKQRATYRSPPWHQYVTKILPSKVSCSGLPGYSDLKAALEGYVSGQIQGVSLDFNTKHCTWGEVLDEASRAEKAYLESGNGPRNVVRKVFRFVGDYSESISPWIDLIPDQDGLSILNGGLKIIFRVRHSYLSNYLCVGNHADSGTGYSRASEESDKDHGDVPANSRYNSDVGGKASDLQVTPRIGGMLY